jgi:hypothetical protein
LDVKTIMMAQEKVATFSALQKKETCRALADYAKAIHSVRWTSLPICRGNLWLDHGDFDPA